MVRPQPFLSATVPKTRCLDQTGPSHLVGWDAPVPGKMGGEGVNNDERVCDTRRWLQPTATVSF